MLNDKVVIVAGGCGRLGMAFVKGIMNHKGACVVADINEEVGEKFIQRLKTQGHAQIDFIPTDLTEIASIQTLIKKTSKKHGHIDAFVNASYPHGRNWGENFEETNFQDFAENASLHLGSHFLAVQQACLFFKQQGFGNIVHISSIQGVMAPKFDTYEGSSYNGMEMTSPAEYSIFKAGVINFTRYIAKFYKGFNIRSNCISPGGIFSYQPDVFLKKYKHYCLSKGMLDPDDITGTLIYLLSDMSKYVNGQNIIVDDGWSL